MTTYFEFLRHPDDAVRFGPDGFTYKPEALVAIDEEAQRVADARDCPEQVEQIATGLIFRLQAKIREYVK